MAIIEGGGSGEPDLTHLWAIITELGEQLSQNRSLSVSLYSQAGKIKHQAINSQTGFVLRRYVVSVAACAGADTALLFRGLTRTRRRVRAAFTGVCSG